MVNIGDKRFAPARNGASPLGRMLSLIDCPHSNLRYLILDCPTESTLDFYLDQFDRLQVSAVVRCCQPTYNAARLAARGIEVVDIPFKDGGVPPLTVVREWLSLVEEKRKSATEEKPATIAVHCVAGLGRAPVLVAIALIEMGMKPLDAIEYIRNKRRGAFNKPQIAFLDNYKRILKTKSSGGNYSFFGRMFRIGSNKNNAVTQQT